MMSTVARAVVPEATHPYEKIPKRNVFNLTTPCPPVVTNPPPVLPHITLTGITTILGAKRALLRVQTVALPGQPSREESYLLAEGQRDGGIEILQIDEAAGTVKIKIAGVLLDLTFINHGARPPTLPAPPAPKQTVDASYPALPRPLGPDEQILLIEIQRAKALDEGDPIAGILPPTELTSEVLEENPSPW